ncbi:MAG: asparagine synthase (glutamine-hydrolyzing) [Lachnospiraceae bacterium]|nr:asparagine synthase (glutamine-hydrolyzing) [Lachnospiraceae bacterium]
MCGICGIYDKEHKIADHRELIVRMNRVQKHRGPDDDGVFEKAGCALGHVRLSIQDLSPAGHQPMTLDDRYTIVFNGEIYNYIELREELKDMGYSFVSECDTEVLLAAYECWGEECLGRFNGFWAFAIYDHRDGSLFLSRDRYGVKPLYYASHDGYTVFASEIKTLLEDSGIKRIVNEQAVVNYLVNGFVDCEDETFFKGVYRLPAGCLMRISGDNDVEIKHWYELPYRETVYEKLPEGTDGKFKDLFEDAIRMRLRSDVPVGSCLSGGLDSSSIVCESAKQLKNRTPERDGRAGQTGQNTYSASYPGSPDDEKRFIGDVIAMSGVSGHYVEPTGDTLFRDLEHLIYTQDEPFVSTSMYASYCVMRLASENGAKVLLDGQGADEILCGYRKARVYYIKKLLSSGHFFRGIRELVLYLPYMRKHNSTLLADISMLRQFLGKDKKGDIKRKYLAPGIRDAKLSRSYRGNDAFILNDFSYIVLPALLRYVDRNAMAFSIEDRLPFLDFRLVEFCMQLPMNAKIEGGYSKAIMRRTLNMPESVRKRRDKIGFYTPEGDWLRAYKDEYRAVFMKDDFRAEKYIDQKAILEDWDALMEKDSIGLFRYICLEKWMEIFDVRAAFAQA